MLARRIVGSMVARKGLMQVREQSSTLSNNHLSQFSHNHKLIHYNILFTDDNTHNTFTSIPSLHCLQSPAVTTRLINCNYTTPAPAPASVKDNNPTQPPEKGSNRLAAVSEVKEEKDMVVFRDVKVKQILDHKTAGQVATVATVSRTDTVFSAIKLMNSVRVGALVVVDAEGKPVGMISERDYLNKVILRGFSSKDITVNGMTLLYHIFSPLIHILTYIPFIHPSSSISSLSSTPFNVWYADIMTSDIKTITADVTAGDCMEMMTQGRFRRIPSFLLFLSSLSSLLLLFCYHL